MQNCGLAPTDKLYTGQTWDASIGLYFYWARYYDPALGCFVAPDKAGPDLKNPQSLNRYSYVLNNPVRYTDPTGNMWEEPGDDGQPGGDNQPPGEPPDPGPGDIGPEVWDGFGDAGGLMTYDPLFQNYSDKVMGNLAISPIQPSGILGEETVPFEGEAPALVAGTPRLDIPALDLYLTLEGPRDWGEWAKGTGLMFAGEVVAVPGAVVAGIGYGLAAGATKFGNVELGLHIMAAAGLAFVPAGILYGEGWDRVVNRAW